MNARSLGGSEYRLSGRVSRKVTTRAGWNPGSTSWSRWKLRISSPAPARSTTARAISTITSAPRARVPARPFEPRAPSRMTPLRSVREVWRAGARPNRTPVSSEIPRAKSSAVPSMPTWSSRGVFCGPSATSARVIHSASATPAAPPASARTRLSVRSCRTMRPLPAPSAERITISPSRAAARTSSRFATLAAAISRTRPTAPSRSSSFLRRSPTIVSCNGVSVMVLK